MCLASIPQQGPSALQGRVLPSDNPAPCFWELPGACIQCRRSPGSGAGGSGACAAPFPGDSVVLREASVPVELPQGCGCLCPSPPASLLRRAWETPLPRTGSAGPSPPPVTRLLPLPVPSNSSAESLDRLYPAVGSSRPPRKRTTSQCKSEPPLLRTSKRTIYTAGRPPWYNEHGTQSKEAFVIGR